MFNLPSRSVKSQRKGFVPRVEKLEARQLLAAWVVDDNFSGAGCNSAHHRCNTIQSAVDAAHAGDTITVRAGSYEENVVVDKRLIIQGENRPTVNPVDDGVAGVPAYGFNLQANDIVIRGFRIGDFNGDAGVDGSVGINTANAFSGYKIRNNVIASNVFGMYLNTATSNSAHQTEVTGNTIRNNNVGAGVLPAAGNGIYSDQGARNVKISGNNFSGHDNEEVIFVAPTALQHNIRVNDNSLHGGSGVFFINVQTSTISNNTIRSSNFNAIELAGGNVNIAIKNNNLQNVGTQGYNGIYLNNNYGVGGNSSNLIQNNTVRGAGLSGIRVRDSSFNVVRGNTVLRAKGFDLSDPAWGNGIGLENGDHNTVESNVVKFSARHGIYVDADSSDNAIRSNVSIVNAQVDPSAFDYNDNSTGDGTGGTDNTYRNNVGGTQNRPGLIRFHT
jgi:parallel beta-helix repeat protein